MSRGIWVTSLRIPWRASLKKNSFTWGKSIIRSTVTTSLRALVTSYGQHWGQMWSQIGLCISPTIPASSSDSSFAPSSSPWHGYSLACINPAGSPCSRKSVYEDSLSSHRTWEDCELACSRLSISSATPKNTQRSHDNSRERFCFAVASASTRRHPRWFCCQTMEAPCHLALRVVFRIIRSCVYPSGAPPPMAYTPNHRFRETDSLWLRWCPPLRRILLSADLWTPLPSRFEKRGSCINKLRV